MPSKRSKTRGVIIRIRWIKAHVNHKGNEAADVLAKDGSQKNLNDLLELPEAPVPYFNGLIRDHFLQLWNQRWKDTATCVKTKRFMPVISGSIPGKLVKYSRTMISDMIQIITDHSFLMSHNHTVDP